jgi:hypothetical protein
VLFVSGFVPTGPSLGNTEQDQCSRNAEQGRSHKEGDPDAGKVRADAAQGRPNPGGDDMTVCKVPSLQPARSRGAVEATKAVAAGTVPVSVPCKSLRPRSCQGLETKPIDPTTTVAVKVARSSISLRPNRSESLPHRGATSAMVALDAPFMNPPKPQHSRPLVRRAAERRGA